MSTALVETDAVVASMRRASSALAEAKTIQQTKKILDVAAAAEIYARRQKLGEEAEDLAASIKVEALRKLGEMLQATPKAKGARAVGGDHRSGGSISAPPESATPTLADLGLTKKESAVAQKLAALPEEQFAQVRDGHVTVAKALVAVAVTKLAKKRAAPKPATGRRADAMRAELREAQQRGVSMLTTYARLTLKAIRSQEEFTNEERELLAELEGAIQQTMKGVSA